MPPVRFMLTARRSMTLPARQIAARLQGSPLCPPYPVLRCSRLLARDDPKAIDCAILPGNRSARGMYVMTSILSQASKPVMV